MGNGFETSDVVLIILSNDSLDTILISNEYCNSGNCVRECEYPVSQNKYLVTVKHDKGYKPEGSSRFGYK